MMKQYFVFIAMFLMTSVGFGQQDPLFTHYTFNTSVINPAYAGQRGVLSVSAFNRSQWAGFPGAPVTQNLNVHAPLGSNKLGVGLNFMHDRLGPTRTTGVFADIAAKIRLGRKSRISLGLKLGSNFRSNDLSEIATNQPNDPNFDSNIQTEILPNAGFGVYYDHPMFYAGISIPRIFKNSLDGEYTGIGDNPNQLERHYYFIAGGIFNLTKDENFKLRPSALLKIAKGSRPQIDLQALVYIHDIVWVGPTFRTFDSFGVLAGTQVTEQLAAGYSFDWSYGLNTGRYNGGSHEFMLRYEFIFRERGGVESPRYF